MKNEFPAAVPEIPVTDMDAALHYYQAQLGFTLDWSGPTAGSLEFQRVTAGCFSQTLHSASMTAMHLQL